MTKSKKPTKKPSKPNTLTVDLDKTESLYRRDKDGGTFAIDPVDNRMTHLDEFDAVEIADAAALGIALRELLPLGYYSECDLSPRQLRDLYSRVFPFCKTKTVHKALAKIGEALSETDENSLRALQLRALRTIAASVSTADTESLFD